MKRTAPAFLLFLSIPLLQAAVVNPDKPLNGEWDLKLTKVWETDKAGDEVLGKPFSLTASEDGILYIHDQANKTSYIFDEDGNFLRAFAKWGQGPGEVMGQELIHCVDGQVYIPTRNGLSVFTREGEYIRTLRQEGRFLNPRIILNTDEIISAPKTAVFLPDGKGEIIRKNIKTGDETSIAGFALEDWGIAHNSESVVDIIVIGFSPLMILGYDENRLYWGMSASYMINVTDLSGKKIDTFSVKRKRRKVSDSFKKKYFYSPSLPKNMLDQIVKSLPNTISFFHRIEVHSGLVYVFVPDVDQKSKSARLKQLDIFSPEGRYLYRAQIEFEPGRHHLFSPLNSLIIQNGHLYAVLTDEQDRPFVAKYEVDLPKGD